MTKTMTSLIVQPYGITPNGTKTSASLNQAMSDLFTDWQSLQAFATKIGNDTDRFNRRMVLQNSALQSIASQLTFSKVVGSPNSLYVDSHNLYNSSISLVSPDTTNVQIFPEYGLVTTQVLNTPVNQFVVLDANNVEWVPSTASIQYKIVSSSDYVLGDDTVGESYIPTSDPDLITDVFTSTATEAWFVDLTTDPYNNEDAYIWINAKLPQEYLYQQTANAIVVHPEPMFGARLLFVSYKANGIWYKSTDTPTSFLPWNSYIPEGGRVAMPEMFLVPPDNISEVKFCYKLPADIGTVDTRAFYLSHIGVYSLQFATSGSLVLDLSSYFKESGQLAAIGHLANPYIDVVQMNQPQITTISTVLRGGPLITGVNVAFSSPNNGAAQALYLAKLVLAVDA